MFLNLSNIKEGNTYKNYKIICDELEVKQLAGNSKKSQIKEWERYFRYDKNGHSFTITHVYDKPLPENNNKTKYIFEIEKLIIDKVVKDHTNGAVFISKSELMTELRMINQNYTYAKYKQLRLSKYMDISMEEVEEFYLTSDSLIKRNIESALNNLRNKALLFWSNAITLCFIKTIVPKNDINEAKTLKHESTNQYGEETASFSSPQPYIHKEYRKATEEEIEMVLELEKKVMKEYGCKTLNEVYKRGLHKKFYKETKNRLFDMANIYFYFNSYEIIANKKYIYDEWSELAEHELEEKERESNKDMLNDELVERIKQNAERRHERGSSSGYQSNNKEEMRKSEDYLKNSYKLTDTLIGRDAVSLHEALNGMGK